MVEHILRDLNQKHSRQVLGIGHEVLDLFHSYTWPGNVRELRNVLERAVIACDRAVIGRAHLPPDFGRASVATASELSALRFPLGTTVEAAERELILQTLVATHNNKTRAAELLAISLKTLHNKLKEYEATRQPAEGWQTSQIGRAMANQRWGAELGHEASPENEIHPHHLATGAGSGGADLDAIRDYAYPPGDPPGRGSRTTGCAESLLPGRPRPRRCRKGGCRSRFRKSRGPAGIRPTVAISKRGSTYGHRCRTRLRPLVL